MTGFTKTDLMGTNTEIHFLYIDETHSCTIQRHQALETTGQVCFYRWLFPTLSNHASASHDLRGINKTACGAKLILMADLASPVSCASLGHLLMAQHCHLCLSACFSPPMAPHPPL